MRKTTGLALLVLAMSSCSVKEDRSVCPCLLNLDFQEVKSFSAGELALTSITPGLTNPMLRESLQPGNLEEGLYSVLVPRQEVTASVVIGMEHAVLEGDTVAIPYGVEGDPVYAFAERHLCEEEEESVKVKMHKQFCRLNIEVVGVEAGGPLSFVMRVRGNSNAMNLFDLEPVSGSFEAVASVVDGVSDVILPRQGEGEIFLDLLDRDGGEVLYTLDLRARLLAAGYDWRAEDLSDVTVTVDYARAEVKVSILPWQDEYDNDEREI